MLSNVRANSQVFFNSRLDFADLKPTPEITDNLKRITGLFISLGDRCLTPVRYFGNGSVITISTKNARLVVEEKKEFKKSSMLGMALRVFCYALTIIPGLVVGTTLKGVGYAISSHVRAAVHGAAFLRYAPSVSECGSKASPIDFMDWGSSVNAAVTAAKAKNSYNCPIDTLIIYAKGDVINDNLTTLLNAFEPNQIKYFLVVSDKLCGNTNIACSTVKEGLQRLLMKRSQGDNKKKVAHVLLSEV